MKTGKDFTKKKILEILRRNDRVRERLDTNPKLATIIEKSITELLMSSKNGVDILGLLYYIVDHFCTANLGERDTLSMVLTILAGELMQDDLYRGKLSHLITDDKDLTVFATNGCILIRLTTYEIRKWLLAEEFELREAVKKSLECYSLVSKLADGKKQTIH